MLRHERADVGQLATAGIGFEVRHFGLDVFEMLQQRDSALEDRGCKRANTSGIGSIQQTRKTKRPVQIALLAGIGAGMQDNSPACSCVSRLA